MDKVRKKVSTKTKVVASAVLVALLVSLALPSLLAVQAGPKEEDVLWREYTATVGDITSSVNGDGKVELEKEEYGYEVPFTLKVLHVSVGDSVYTGDLLAEIDEKAAAQKLKDLENELSKAKNTWEDALANCSKSGLTFEQEQSGKHAASRQKYEQQRQQLEKELSELDSSIATLQAEIAALEKQIEGAVANPPGSQDAAPPALSEPPATPETAAEPGGVPPEPQPTAEGAPPSPEEAPFTRADSVALPPEGAIGQREQWQQQLDEKKNALGEAQARRADKAKELDALNAARQQEISQENAESQTAGKTQSLEQQTLNNAIENARKEVERLETAMKDAQWLVDNPKITAKNDGVVTALDFKPGDEVAAGKPVVQLGQGSKRYVRVGVSQEDILKVEVGQEVELECSAYPGQIIKGRVTEKNLKPIDMQKDVGYEVLIEVQGNEHELLGGMTASVKFITKRLPSVLQMNNKAIFLENGRQYVLVKTPTGAPEKREITTGFSDGRVSEITGGLNEGDVAVVEG